MVRIAVLFGIMFSCCFGKENPSVLVSTVTYVDIVSDLLGAPCTVTSLIPPYVNFHTYEPTMVQMTAVKESQVWFYLGDSFERGLLRFFQSQLNSPRLILLPGSTETMICSCAHEQEGGVDRHTWTNPVLMEKQIDCIAETLMGLYPDRKENILKMRKIFSQRLFEIDKKFKNLFCQAKGRPMIVAHAGFGYFCHQYGIRQVSLEVGGKEPTLRDIESVLSVAKEHGVHTVFALKGHSRKGIDMVAQILGATVIEVDPYLHPYLATMEQFGNQVYTALCEEHEYRE